MSRTFCEKRFSNSARIRSSRFRDSSPDASVAACMSCCMVCCRVRFSSWKRCSYDAVSSTSWVLNVSCSCFHSFTFCRPSRSRSSCRRISICTSISSRSLARTCSSMAFFLATASSCNFLCTLSSSSWRASCWWCSFAFSCSTCRRNSVFCRLHSSTSCWLIAHTSRCRRSYSSCIFEQCPENAASRAVTSVSSLLKSSRSPLNRADATDMLRVLRGLAIGDRCSAGVLMRGEGLNGGCLSGVSCGTVSESPASLVDKGEQFRRFTLMCNPSGVSTRTFPSLFTSSTVACTPLKRLRVVSPCSATCCRGASCWLAIS
eukprot:Sspe_Gene.6210::Locus_2093_Transcript_2_2_Confidence_0.444_Length_2435::g.6210::m.6210